MKLINRWKKCLNKRTEQCSIRNKNKIILEYRTENRALTIGGRDKTRFGRNTSVNRITYIKDKQTG